jgi:hypothetical protein
MMHDREKSDSVIVAEKPTNKAASAVAEPVEPRTGPRGSREGKARTGHRAGHACHRRSTVNGKWARRFAVITQGRSRMREFRSYGSARGAAGNSRSYRERSSATDHDSSTLRSRQLRHEMRCRKLYPRKLPKVDRKEWADFVAKPLRKNGRSSCSAFLK